MCWCSYWLLFIKQTWQHRPVPWPAKPLLCGGCVPVAAEVSVMPSTTGHELVSPSPPPCIDKLARSMLSQVSLEAHPTPFLAPAVPVLDAEGEDTHTVLFP